jgi:hypothetical protein
LPDLDEGLGWNAEPLMQSSDHIESQLAPPIEHLVHSVSAAYEGYEIARLQSALLHVVPDRFHRIRQIEPVMFALPRFHQRDQYIEPISFGRVAPGIHQSLDLPENPAIITIGFDRCDIHD